MEDYNIFGVTDQGSISNRPDEAILIAQYFLGYRDGLNTPQRLRDRLTQILQTTEWFGQIGCILCFATTGSIHPDHTLRLCTRISQLESIRRSINWLETLNSSTPVEDFCSFCQLFHPCGYNQEYYSYCTRLPTILQVIAVLGSYSNYVLGHVVAYVASSQGNVDLTSEAGTRSWLEKQISIELNGTRASFPNLLLVYEMMVVPFYYKLNAARKAEPLLGFPLWPAGQVVIPIDNEASSFTSMENSESLKQWECAIRWWANPNKCSFCVGRYMKGNLVRHTLRQCPRRGKEDIDEELEGFIYDDRAAPTNGCPRCKLPFSICGSWIPNTAGKWIPNPPGYTGCGYDPSLFRDTIIGLIESGNITILKIVHKVVKEYCTQKGLPQIYDGEYIASALSRRLTTYGDGAGSNMIQVLYYMTETIWQHTGKD